MNNDIRDLAMIQDRVGKLPGPRDMKVISFLDKHALRWLMLSSFAMVSVGFPGALGITTAGGAGFVQAEGDDKLRLALESVDDGSAFESGAACGCLFFVKGMTETLRINGLVEAINASEVTIVVQECYLHCGKALLRSEFWSISPESHPEGSVLASSSLLALATISASGFADVSPKGDPSGQLLREVDGELCFADRPGNRRIDSFRNILEEPQVAFMALKPGSSKVLRVLGRASVSDNENLRSLFAVKGRRPALVTRISVEHSEEFLSSALRRAALWRESVEPPLCAADIFRDHVRLSKEKGLGAGLTRVAVSVPGLLKRGLASDYEKNMY